ncbi:unnamed protein product [Cuscuta campestris]|uniref:Uncharacterized protein n=1 Tax=Cuscuta campestris TaxID=132261 RepID=A0A484KZC4_9ASTE|nr:unnamed protein product [Cuscuta campestris]
MSLLIPVSAHFGAQYSVCSDIREAINNIEKKLSPSQMEEFRRTPIGWLTIKKRTAVLNTWLISDVNLQLDYGVEGKQPIFSFFTLQF